MYDARFQRLCDDLRNASVDTVHVDADTCAQLEDVSKAPEARAEVMLYDDDDDSSDEEVLEHDDRTARIVVEQVGGDLRRVGARTPQDERVRDEDEHLRVRSESLSGRHVRSGSRGRGSSFGNHPGRRRRSSAERARVEAEDAAALEDTAPVAVAEVDPGMFPECYWTTRKLVYKLGSEVRALEERPLRLDECRGVDMGEVPVVLDDDGRAITLHRVQF